MRATILTVRPTSRTFTRRASMHDQTPCTYSNQSPHQSPIHLRCRGGRNRGHCYALRRYSGKENSSNDVSLFSSSPIEKRKSPWENLTPGVDVLVGKNSPVTPPILAGTNQLCGSREIPHFLNGVFVGQFLPQVQIPSDHPHGEIIRWAAATLRALPAYLTTSDTLSTKFLYLLQ